jgi:HEAT repeat protein
VADYDHHYLKELRTSEELARCFISQRWDTEDGSHAATTLHFRGGKEEFEIGRRYTESLDAWERAAGADILGQLGAADKTFCEESVDVLIPLLKDPDPSVVYSAGIALGHRNDPRAIGPLLELIDHADAKIRYGVVVGLSRHDQPEAIAGLIRLSADSDDSNRDWATFGLGRMTSVDTPALREALLARLTDADPEIRGEAMIGLARRGDERVCPAIERELRGEFYGDWSVEAAGLLAKREWVPLLEAQWKTLSTEDGAAFASTFEAAITACRQSEMD